MKRRDFIKTAGGFALVSVAQTVPVVSSLAEAKGSSPHEPRIAVMYDPSIPGEISSVTKDILQQALNGWDVAYLSPQELPSRLTIRDHDLIINPYGSCFPKESWNALYQFLRDGGNWVNLGGIPFSVPVVYENGVWRKEVRTTAYHKKLGIFQAFPVSAKDITAFIPQAEEYCSAQLVKEFTAEEIYELYVRFTEVKDYPSEDGTGGPRDAHLRALVFGTDEHKQKLAAPIVQIDRLQGSCAGGRWILANFSGTITPIGIRTLAEKALQGSMEFITRASFACYHEGEMPSFTLQFRRPKGDVTSFTKNKCSLTIRDDEGKTIGSLDVRLRGDGTIASGVVDMISRKKESLPPGLYHVDAVMKVTSISADTSYDLHYRTGFWVLDEGLMSAGKPLTADENYLRRDGQPYPVTGTTYMGSDVHRKFLFEPNPHVWDEDFKAMKHSGINMVRTGIWTGWKNFMLDVGSPNESTLRAMDAFLLTARKYDIPLIFTFFAFLPESWGGINPFLDPRSVNAQKEFITAFASRYRGVNDVLWDLINEPSFCSPAHLWQCRPNYDTFEVAAWNAWLKERYPASSDGERTSRLQELYHATADEPISLPALEEFDDVNIFGDRRPVKVIDYRLFAQEMFRRWVMEMKEALRANGNRHQLITVGQDEGGTSDRPANQFFGDSVDFTCLHNWWANDDLLWDSIMTKLPGKANLVEETGIMFYEKMDGSPWRTEEDARNLLERKLAFSFVGGAGFVEWIWNTNSYMTLDNEAAIGLLRADGTAKPELEPVVNFAKFFAENRHLMKERVPEEVVMVIPHSQMFSTRDYATEATKRCVRAMCYHCNTPMYAVSEYRIESLPTDSPKLIIVPAPRALNEQSWQALRNLVRGGSTLLISGTFDADEHWLPVARSKEFNKQTAVRPVAQEEFLTLEGKQYQLSFRGDKIQRIEKAVAGTESILELIPIDTGGRIIWSLLPVELAENIEPIVALYTYALRKANIAPIYSAQGKDPSVLIMPTIFEEAVLYTCISESDRDTTCELQHHEAKKSISVTVPAQRTVMIFISRKEGTIISKMG